MEIEFELDHFPKQEEVFNSVVDEDYKYYILNISRGGGKTIVLVDLVMYYLFGEDIEDILFVSKTIPQAKKVFTQVKNLLEDCDLIRFVTVINQTDRIIRLKDGSQIIFKSGEIPDNLRGQNEHTIVICDEFAFYNSETWEIALRQICGIQKVKKVVISSTPNGYHNAFYTMSEIARNEEDSRYKYFSYDYRDNPYGQVLEDVMQAKKDMPSWKFAQEYECAFVGDGFSAFSDIEEVCCLDRQEPSVSNFVKRKYCAGIDIGLANDYTVVSIMNDLGEQVDLLRFNNVSTDVWINKVVAFLVKWQVSYVIAEENYEKTLLNLLRVAVAEHRDNKRLGLGIRIEYHRTMASNKTKDVEKLIVAFDYRQVKLLNDKTLIGEFERFTKVDLKDSYTYRADTGNDDIVMAVMLNYLILNRIKNGTGIRVR